MRPKPVSALILALLLCASLASGEGPKKGGPLAGRPSPTSHQMPLSSPNEFGTSYGVTSVSAAALTSDNSSLQVLTTNYGYRYFPAGAAQFIGNISLPSGVVVDYLGLNTCDTAGGSFTFTLYDSTVGTAYVSVGTIVSTANTPGCGFDYTNVFNPINYSYTANAGHNLELYIYQEASAATDGTNGVQSAEVWWHRQVSPAPATASFNDVPTGHPFFQYIEALYASGITGGCGSGNYCPDAPLTRGQMAVFLSKALGLNWPF